MFYRLARIFGEDWKGSRPVGDPSPPFKKSGTLKRTGAMASPDLDRLRRRQGLRVSSLESMKSYLPEKLYTGLKSRGYERVVDADKVLYLYNGESKVWDVWEFKESEFFNVKSREIRAYYNRF